MSALTLKVYSKKFAHQELLTQRPLLCLRWCSDDGQARPRFARSPKARGRSLDLRHDARVIVVHAGRRRLVQRMAALIRQVTLEK